MYSQEECELIWLTAIAVNGVELLRRRGMSTNPYLSLKLETMLILAMDMEELLLIGRNYENDLLDCIKKFPPYIRQKAIALTPALTRADEVKTKTLKGTFSVISQGRRSFLGEG
jgi:hypothetical protein